MLVLSPAEVSLLTSVGLVLSLKHAVPGRVCAEHANCPSGPSEPGEEAGISGITFVWLFSFPLERLCVLLTAKGNTAPVIPGHGTVGLWICGWAESWLSWCPVFLGCPQEYLPCRSCSSALLCGSP